MDPWQQDALTDALGVTPEGRWSSPEVALILPRQNGKGSVLEAWELYCLFLWDDCRLILHTAHRFDTAQDHFKRIRSLVENTPALSKRVKAIRVANGSEGIELKDGTRLLFKARSKGGTRGLTADALVLDEAFYLWDESVSAMLPTISARPNPQVWYTSSSPIPGPESEVLRRLCRRGRKGDDRLAYIEYSAPEGADLDDRQVWHDANPSLGVRLQVSAVEGERGAMSDEAFATERLGIWTEDAGTPGAIDMGKWAGCSVGDVPAEWIGDDITFGVEGNASTEWVSVVASGKLPDGRVAMELAKHELGTDWLVPWALEANERHQPKAWVFDPRSVAADLYLAAFRDAGLPVIECGMKDRALFRATAAFVADVHNDRVRVLTHPLLDAAVANAGTRPYGESWLFGPKHPGAAVMSPLHAANLARFGLTEEPEAEAPTPFLIYR